MSLPPTAMPAAGDPPGPADLFLAFWRHPDVIRFVDRASFGTAITVVALNLAAVAWTILS